MLPSYGLPRRVRTNATLLTYYSVTQKWVVYNRGEDKELKMARELWIKQFNMVCVKSGEVVMQESQMLNLEHAADELGVPVVGVDDEEVTLLVDCGCGGNSYKCGV